MKKPWTDRDDLVFCVTYALSKSPHIIKSVRKSDGAKIIAKGILEHLELCGWEVLRRERQESGL